MKILHSSSPRGRTAMVTATCILAGCLLLCASARAQHLNGATGTHLDLSGAAHLVVPGNIDLAGTSSFSSTSRLVLSSAGDYKIEGIPRLPYLHVVSSNDITLTEPLEITGGVHIAGGRLVLGDNDLTLATGATITGSFSADNMIVADDDGRLAYIWGNAGSYTYPVGDETGTVEYSPVTLLFTSGILVPTAVSVRVTDAKHPQNGSTTDYLTRYWTLDVTGTAGFLANVQCTYVDADIMGTEANLSGGRCSGSAWHSLGPVVQATNLVTGIVTAFGDFTAGESAAVPVELTAFSAVLKASTVYLHWETATELNNFGFAVERLTGSGWQEIGFVTGAGNSTTPRRYDFRDELKTALLRQSELLYRLRQVDHDGTETLSPVVRVQLGTQPAAFALHAPYPNPTAGQAQLSFTLVESGPVELSLHDLIGREVAVVAKDNLEAGYHLRTLQIGGLPDGVYLLRLTTSMGSRVRRLVVYR